MDSRNIISHSNPSNFETEMKNFITILGAGESGFGALKLARKHGMDVFLSDVSAIKQEVQEYCNANGVEFEMGSHSEKLIMQSSEIIKSPGIPDNAPIIQSALANGIPVIDELEFASRYTNATIVVITGTNGKTTTTMLTAHLLKIAGLDAVAVGNVGNSFAGELAYNDHDFFVVEASSFQLDGLKDFRADVGILLNITPDHINRYGTMENYTASKNRLGQLIKNDGVYIVNGDDHLISQDSSAQTVQLVSLSSRNTAACLTEDGMVIQGEVALQISTNEISLKGKHNFFNAMCVILAAKQCGVSNELIRQGLKSFQAVPHRLELVGAIKGVNFVNDSKATNVDAVKYALDSFEHPLIWIAGGVDKGNNYQEIEALVRKHVKALICLGTDNGKLKKAFSSVIKDISETQDIKLAVQMALNYAEKNDVVLLSPACASFDLFKNYEDRGDQFRTAVKELTDSLNQPVR